MAETEKVSVIEMVMDKDNKCYHIYGVIDGLPATVESLGFVMHVAADRITVEKNPKQGMSHDLILPAHLRDGRVWIGTPQQEDAVRARIQEIDEERLVIENAHGGVLPQEADDALALAERSVSRNPLRRLLREFEEVSR